MARPLAASDHGRGGKNGHASGRQAAPLHELIFDEIDPNSAEAAEADGEQLQAENTQLRELCAELEQALQEATAHPGSGGEETEVKEYEALLEEKTEVIRGLHEQIQELETALAANEQARVAAAAQPQHRHNQGPAPREEELLALSEELERERRQLQEDEQSVMDQMRQMEVSMAKERAEMARQRSELLRLQSEIHHELERLERNGALQSKMEGLKNRLADVSARRGSAPAAQGTPAASPSTSGQAPAPPPRKDGLMSRWFGQGRSS
jgi:chromosome segregation ATPase